MADLKNTQFIDINQTKRISVSEVILRVYQALVERGYNPVNQIVGYIMSGDPTLNCILAPAPRPIPKATIMPEASS